MPEARIFEDTKTAFQLQSDADLKRARFLFRMIANPSLVRIGTGLTNLALNLNLPVKGLIRKTVFNHFCGGVTSEECMPKVHDMYSVGVSSILDYSVEGKSTEEVFDAVLAKKLELIEHAAHEDALPFEVIKPTGLGRFAIWQAVTENKELTSDEQAEWNRVKQRIDTVCAAAHKADVALLVDGEESWMQDASDNLIDDMMARYNKDRAIIYNTVQLYRHDRMAYCQQLLERAKTEDFIAGVKLVRGAYMEKENLRAETMGYPTPICASKAETDANYDRVLDFILDNLDHMALCVATHNEASTLRAMQHIAEHDIDPRSDKVWFGQLYGMSDNLTYNLADHDYNSFKIVPFGPVKDVMPYLIRRAQENTSVAGQTGRELALIEKELKRRKAAKKSA